jgi:hypothetical protein
MGGGSDKVIVNNEKVISRQRPLAMCGMTKQTFAAGKGPRHERRITCGADAGKETFEIVANARKVIVYRFRVDVVTHENGVEA